MKKRTTPPIAFGYWDKDTKSWAVFDSLEEAVMESNAWNNSGQIYQMIPTDPAFYELKTFQVWKKKGKK